MRKGGGRRALCRSPPSLTTTALAGCEAERWRVSAGCPVRSHSPSARRAGPARSSRLHQIAEQRVVGLRPFHHQSPMGEVARVRAGIAVALHDQRQQLPRPGAWREHAGSCRLPRQLPFLVERRSRPSAVIVARVDLEHRELGRQGQRERAFMPWRVLEREDQRASQPFSLDRVMLRRGGDAFDRLRVGFAQKQLGPCRRSRGASARRAYRNRAP